MAKNNGKSSSKKGSKAAAKAVGAPSKATDLAKDTAEAGELLTTNQGLVMGDDQNSLKAGVRGPTLLEDFHFREKITHFDHERIPERVVHARGAAAHGYFEAYAGAAELCKAGLFSEEGKRTPVFVRFSTVAGSRGSADTPRDVRGFAVKFYTEEGVWDLVGNNMPVFFIQDAIKFPDFVHSVKPEPHNEIPQAQSAHDTFWDFVSLTPESTHMLMWVMSDRALPRSFSMMEGFGIHTFRMIDQAGKSRFVKFHWKPVKGVHSLVWDEAQKLAGKDPDYNRRDLWEAIEKGDYPQWEFGVQVVEEKDERKFDFDLLDPTKIIPEELVPVRKLGRMVLNRNPDNFFAETEQVAFHPGHVVSGIDFSNDPLLQGRLFSYIDTQIKRVGPNFAEIPINRPTCPVHNHQRDGESRQTINKGRVSYFPNSLANGCPMHSPEGASAFHSVAEKMEGTKVRMRSPSFADHHSQATLFWNSMASWEKKHIIEAISFELNMVETLAVKKRVLAAMFGPVADELALGIAERIGVKFTPLGSGKKKGKLQKSEALSMDKPPAGDIQGRKVAILVGDGVDGKQVADAKRRLMAEGAMGEVIAKVKGPVTAADGKAVEVDRAAPNAPSVIYDAVLVPGGEASAAAVAGLGVSVHFVTEAYTHFKTIAAVGAGLKVLEKAGVTGDMEGVVTGDAMATVLEGLIEGMKKHRHYLRKVESVPA